jgi:hypothetical protein
MEEMKELISDTVNPWLQILPKDRHQEFVEKFELLIKEMLQAKFESLVNDPEFRKNVKTHY